MALIKKQTHIIKKLKFLDECQEISKINRTVSIGHREINSVLTFKMSKETYGLINRDYNATKNIQEIVRNLLEKGKRPKEFERTKKPEPVKGENLDKGENLHI